MTDTTEEAKWTELFDEWGLPVTDAALVDRLNLIRFTYIKAGKRGETEVAAAIRPFLVLLTREAMQRGLISC